MRKRMMKRKKSMMTRMSKMPGSGFAWILLQFAALLERLKFGVVLKYCCQADMSKSFASSFRKPDDG